MNEKLEQVRQITKKYGQEQLMREYERLKTEEEKENFLNEILSIDFKEIEGIYKNRNQKADFSNSKIEPINYIDKSKLSKEEYEEYEKIGTKEIKEGKLAVVTMAGGQGTRLGHSGPKGTFDIGLDSHKSIFEILTNTMIEAKNKYKVNIPWYIMTSEENDNDTRKFFEDNNYFGYPKNYITFFIQGKLPMCDLNGKILINEKNHIKQASDGHGGIFSSLKKAGMIYDMKARNIEWVFICGVDNVLVKPVDPIVIGLAVKNKVLAVGKSIEKASPSEKVGVFCKRNGKPSVVEYSEISKEMAEKRDQDGNLIFGESHILCNLFSIKAIEKISGLSLPYHVAFKKAQFLDESGKLIEKPDKPNAYKFESFLFDAFESLGKIAILRVKREDEFAPVKNAEGVDSPETARKLYIDYYKRKNIKK